MKKFPARATTIILPVLFLLIASPALRAQQPAPSDAAETELALRRLGVTGSVLYVGAHPDDENTALLAYLAREVGRSEEHTSELQSLAYLVCRLLLEKQKSNSSVRQHH